MLIEARVLLALAALAALALVYAERGVKPALAPLCAMGSAALFVSAFGAFGLLRLGGWLFYLAALAGVGWLVWRLAVKKAPMPKPDFGFWFFVAASLCCILLLWAKRPMFQSWDEFSFWGTAGKLLKTYDELYTTAPIGWIWNSTQTPVLPVLGYLFQFFGPGFVEWQSYAATDVLMFAAMAAVLAPFQGRRWKLALPAALACLLTPYVFLHYMQVDKVSPVYMDSMADIPLGFVFGAAVCCWFASDKRSPAALVPTGIALATLTMMKDMTSLVLALVACVLILCDGLFARYDEKPGPAGRAKGALIPFGASLGAVLLPFALWSAYSTALTGASRLENAGGRYEVGLGQIPLMFVQDLLAPEKDDFFLQITGGMVNQFLHTKNTLLGTGLMVALGVLALVGLAAVVTTSPAHRRRCWVFGLFSALGYGCYSLYLTMSYLYIMRPEQAFESYERYVFPYYIAWLLCALLLLGRSLNSRLPELAALPATPAKPGLAARLKAGWRPLAGGAAVLGLSAIMLLRVGQLVPAAFTLAGVHPSEFNQRRAYARNVESLTGLLDPEGRTFFISSGDTGIGWFMLSYQMLPWQLDYSVGGGDLEERVFNTQDGTRTTRLITAGELEAYLAESGCTTAYIQYADEAFKQRYQSVFEDGMAAYFAGETDLYAVQVENGKGRLVPMASARPYY